MQAWHQDLKQKLPDVRIVILQAGVRVAARVEESEFIELERYQVLTRACREFIDHVRASHENPQQTENPRAELGLILAMQQALEGLPK